MAVKICPSCGEGNKEHAVICIVCGTSLKQASLQGTLNADKEMDTSLYGSRRTSKVCSHCREPLEEGAMKCKYCGTLASRAAGRESHNHHIEVLPPVPDNTAMTLIMISTILIPITGLIIGGVASFNDDQDKRDSGKMLLFLGLAILVIQIILFFIFT
ncbi:double zinc ribbon domain-containing protein [Paenibacillus lemnae]|uniref:DZANK-type domain-containing protein n=1 Tax=Paenibacillus lemnae TaxID=1330551 RepID=A0A848M790_PAELE|nr:zinc ribbon domain-containing protein [Paenibacillus lemnae]NMO96555.1 hypothetical protein [Paenibacillus lemnae]